MPCGSAVRRFRYRHHHRAQRGKPAWPAPACGVGIYLPVFARAVADKAAAARSAKRPVPHAAAPCAGQRGTGGIICNQRPPWGKAAAHRAAPGGSVSMGYNTLAYRPFAGAAPPGTGAVGKAPICAGVCRALGAVQPVVCTRHQPCQCAPCQCCQRRSAAHAGFTVEYRQCKVVCAGLPPAGYPLFWGAADLPLPYRAAVGHFFAG